MSGPCLCGDLMCPSCGPAQGNSRCPNCGKWSADGGCDDPVWCDIQNRKADEEAARDWEESERWAEWSERYLERRGDG